MVDSYFEAYRMWAYPKLRKSSKKIYLHTLTPGLVSYVLDDDWETRLGTKKYFYDDTTTMTEADEIALATRILKAGGAVLEFSYRHSDAYDEALNTAWSNFEKRRECIFGWPDTGGVWVLHLVPPTLTRDTEEGMIAIEEMYEMVATGEESAETFRFLTEGPLNLKVLRNAKSMTEYCAELKKLGGKFYENPGDSEEVEKCGLRDTDQMAGLWN